MWIILLYIFMTKYGFYYSPDQGENILCGQYTQFLQKICVVSVKYTFQGFIKDIISYRIY